MTFGMSNWICNNCCWLLVAGDLQTPVIKKTGVILIINGLASNN